MTRAAAIATEMMAVVYTYEVDYTSDVGPATTHIFGNNQAQVEATMRSAGVEHISAIRLVE